MTTTGTIPDIMRAKDIADLLRISVTTVNRYGQLGLIPSVITPGGKHRRFRRADVLELVGGHEGPFLTPDEVGKKFRVSAHTVMRWARLGRLEYIELPSTERPLRPLRRFPEQTVDRLLEARRIAGM